VKEIPLPIPNRRFYAWLGLGFLAFVLYGSWVPFRFVALPLDQAIAQFKDVLTEPVRIESRSDWVANILLMIPAGFSLMGALGADRPRGAWLGDTFLVIAVCLCISVLAEFGQLFIPGRFSSLNDIVAQGVGCLLGAALWGLSGQSITLWSRQFWHGSGPATREAHLLPAYLAALLVLYLLPLDLSLSPAQVYHKFKDGHINLVPFLSPRNDPYAYAQRTILNVVYFAALGLLLGGLPGQRWRDHRQVGWVLGWAIVFVGFLNGLKLLVASRSFDVTDVVVEVLAVVCGWRIRLFLRDRDRPGFAGLASPVWRGCLLGAWLSLLAFVTWQPFDLDFGLAGERLKGLSVLPFADLRLGKELLALQNEFEKLILYLPLGILLTSWSPHSHRLFWLPTLLIGFLVALTLEAGQLVLVSRTASLSDVYVETAGAVLGGFITRHACLLAGPR
jgi:VanZ family protein